MNWYFSNISFNLKSQITGRDGEKPLIRFGWLRALLFLFLLLPVTYGSALIADNLIGNSVSGEIPVEDLSIVYLITALGSLLLVVFFTVLIDRRSLLTLGFHVNGFERDAATGFFAGSFLLSIGSILLVVSGYLHFSSLNVDAENLFLNLMLFAVVAFVEEIIFRGYILNNLLDSFKPWAALTISALVFGLVHMTNPGSDWLPVLNIFIAGFLLGINYIYTRNLWFSIMFHLSWNFFQGPVYGFEVSGYITKGLFVQFMDGPQWLTGGSFGFEGSVVATLLTVLAVVFFARYYHKTFVVKNEVATS